jgi:glycosyltransferase involved in cell wall biosynthesis
MKKNNRIAVFLPNLNPGGAEKLHLILAREWEKSGIKTDFLLRNKCGSLCDQIPESSSIIDLKANRVRNSFWPLVKYLSDTPPDAIIAAMWPLTIIAPLAAKVANYRGKVILSEHSPLSIAYSNKGSFHRYVMKLSQRICYPISDVVVAVSSGVASDLSLMSGIDVNEFAVIHNPAAKGNVDPAVSPPLLLQSVSGPLILSVGTLKNVKRHDLLIKAFAKLPVEINATLAIIGEGDKRDSLINLADKLKLSNRVFLPGFISDPGPWYAHADLFVLSSDYEGFGNVIVEALEYGLPVVSTDCPFGPSEILDGGKYGALVRCNDSDALCAEIFKALSSNVNSDALRERAKDFDSGVIAKRYLELMFADAH